MSIGEQLQQARKAQHLTQAQLAEQLHVTRQTISNWEVGRSYPDLASVVLLADTLTLSLDQLLKGDVRMMNDAKHKEQERQNARLLYWGTQLSTLMIVGIIAAFALNWPGSAMGHLTQLGLLAVLLVSIAVSLLAQARYRQTTTRWLLTRGHQLVALLGGTVIGGLWATIGLTGWFWGITAAIVLGLAGLWWRGKTRKA
ncbi:helix-turn-helix domain-containing protein [Lacticaseibacillus daqingensis]|uniref:helix-turn-helix domain-containing protein n=1 Tax=Lacticaseibacillus daqingensis TaxID=2486014 RepID=UPI000F767874|nr:helix-turn-helix domain-containing protein [Lacticaseibacillus daqingensis]